MHIRDCVRIIDVASILAGPVLRRKRHSTMSLTRRRPQGDAAAGPPTKKKPGPNHDTFIELGSEIMNRHPWTGSEVVFDRRWTSHFAVEPAVCVDVWTRLRIGVPDPESEPDKDEKHAKPVHLLWALLLVKTCKTEEDLACKCGGVDEQMFRKWGWFFIDRVSHLEFEVIVWSNRLVGDKGLDCLVTVDCTDCQATSQGKNPKAFHSFKFKKAGLRCEVCVCILTGNIVWINGPFPCGDWPDLEIFRHSVKHHLGENERVEADDGYGAEDPECVKSTSGIRHMEPKVVAKARGAVRNKQETANDRLKLFGCLSQRFRHDIRLHGQCFRACAVAAQLSFEHGKGLFSTEDLCGNLKPSPKDVPLPKPDKVQSGSQFRRD